MKKILFLSAFLIVSTIAAAQTANNECDLYIKKKIIVDKEVSSAKQEIPISHNGKNNISFNAMLGSQSLILMFSRQKEEMKCVSKTSNMNLEFNDKTHLDITHMGDTDCEGMFVIMLGEIMENSEKLQMIKTKKIKKIAIEYQDIIAEKIITISEENVLTPAESDKILKTIQCLSK